MQDTNIFIYDGCDPEFYTQYNNAVGDTLRDYIWPRLTIDLYTTIDTCLSRNIRVSLMDCVKREALK